MRYRALLVAAAAALVVTPALGEDPAEAYCSANGYDADFDKDLTAYRDSDGEKIKCGDIVEADDDLWAKCCCDDDEYCCMNLDVAFSGTLCEATSCGVTEGNCPP